MFRGIEGFVLRFSGASLELRVVKLRSSSQAGLAFAREMRGAIWGASAAERESGRVTGVRVLLFHQEKSSLVHRDTFKRMVYGVLKVLCFLGLRSLSSWAKG